MIFLKKKHTNSPYIIHMENSIDSYTRQPYLTNIVQPSKPTSIHARCSSFPRLVPLFYFLFLANAIQQAPRKKRLFIHSWVFPNKQNNFFQQTKNLSHVLANFLHSIPRVAIPHSNVPINRSTVSTAHCLLCLLRHHHSLVFRHRRRE